MNLFAKAAIARAARKRARRKTSKATPLGSVALARGARTGNGPLTALGTALLVFGAARRRSKRGKIIYRRKLRPGDAVRLAVTREGRLIEPD